MKRKYDIEEIKRLLDTYYEGNTSIEQEKLLCDFFASATEIPSELEADRHLFNSLLFANKDHINVPDNLEVQLISHIDNLEKAENINNRKWIKPFAYLSAVACIIALFTIGVKFINIENKLIENETILVSGINSNDTIDNKNDNIAKIERQEPDIAESAIEVPQKTNAKKVAKRQRINKTRQLKSISEEQIAYENTEKALLLLSEKLNKAQEGINKTKSTINDINNTIIDII